MGRATARASERLISLHKRQPSDHDPLDFIEAYLIAPTVIKLRVEAWFAIAAAFSSVPPFLRYAVIPVARKLWLPSLVAMPAAAARRPIIA
jgi:hypothetical protein